MYNISFFNNAATCHLSILLPLRPGSGQPQNSPGILINGGGIVGFE